LGYGSAAGVVVVASGVEQLAGHQVVFREVNEQIAKLTGLFVESGYGLFICECSDPDCSDAANLRRP
jgi:hypothetical protein